MKHYKIIFVIAFLALICSMSFVSANELNNATNLEKNDLSLEESDFQVDVLSTANDDSSINSNYNSSLGDDLKIGSSSGEEVLNASAGEKTIDDLKKEVANTPDGGTLVLNSDYGPDKTLYVGIGINKSITIDGNNHRIRGIPFGIVTDKDITVVFKNMRFTDESKAVIYVDLDKGRFVLDGCVFENCKSKKSGPVQIYASAKGAIEIKNCIFNKCAADPAGSSGSSQWYNTMAQWSAQSRAYRSLGGAVFIYTDKCIIENCNFTECKAGEGGAIFIRGIDNVIKNCNFVSNHAFDVFETDSRGVGGAICLNGGLEILNSTFKHNTASKLGGGAIKAEFGIKYALKIKGCTFIANYITTKYNPLTSWSGDYKGGTINSRNEYTEISNCYFEGTPEDLCRKGGAIYIYKESNPGLIDPRRPDPKLSINDCIFKNFKAKEGGAIYCDSDTKSTLMNSSFTGNTVKNKGGAIYLNSKNNVIDGCAFDSNSADDDGGAIYVEARYNSIKNSQFTNNKAKDEGGAVYINARYTKIHSSNFFSNTAKKGYDIYCDSSYCELYGSIILGNTPKNAVYSSKSFSAEKNWWGNIENNRNVKPDVNKKVDLENNWLYLKDEVKYDHTGSLPSAVVKTSIWSNKFNYEVTGYLKLSFDMEFTNTASNTNKMDCGGVSDFIIPLTTTNTAVTLSKRGWSYKINLKYDTPIYNRSFSHLKYDVDNSGSVLNLTTDYEYMDACDKNLINGITFNKELVIDGNGHTINGKNTASLLQGGYGKDLTLKNINFINIKNIYKANGNLFIENCTFNNCGNGLELLRITAGVITISDSNFYNCSSYSSMFIFDAYGGPDVSIIRCEFIGNKANCLMEGYRCESFNFIQNIFLNNSFTNMHNFKMGNPAHANYDYNWFGNTIYDFDTKPHVNVDLNNWMVLDLVNSKNTFETKYVYLKVYNANSQELENNTALNIGFNVSSIGGVVGFVDVNSGIGIMNYTFALRDVITLSYISNNFSFYIVNYLPGSFADLQYQINSAGSVLNLTCNYEYMPVCDFKLKHIIIDKPLILNGNGFTIDANGMVAIARITAGNVQILNATFINSYSSHNAAIEIYADNVLINSTFINNTLSSRSNAGAAVKIGSSNNVVIYSTFIKNSNLLGSGGAIFIDQSNNVVIDSIFVNNTAILGGAIYSEWSDVSISGVFANNSAKNGAAIYIHARSDKLNRIYKSLFISNRGIDSVINVAGTPKFHAADVHHSIFIDNNCLYDIASSNKDIVYADYNWFGNTNENYNVKPNVASSVNLNRWLFLDANANSTLLKIDESAVINLSLNKAYDHADKKIYDVGTNLPDVCFDVSSVNNAAIMDKLELVDGKGNASYVPVDVGMGSVDFKYYSFNKTVTFNVVTVPEDSFTKLQEIINNASVYDSIVLNRSYKYYPNFDSDLKKGIVINKELLLNGNGHVIDGSNQARLFNLTKPSIQLDNLILVNGYAENGSVIYSIRPGNKLFNSIVLNSTDSLIYSTNYFSVDNCWFGNTVDDYDVAPVVEGDYVELNNWLFLTVDVSKFDLFVGESAVVTLNLTNLYNANGTNSTWTNIIPFAFDLSYFGGDVNVSEATLMDGISKFEFTGYDFESGYLTASYYDVNEEFYFNVTCDDDSFTALQKLIDNANGKVILQHNYKYYDYDEKYKNGILIDKSIVIDGDGYVIDALNKASVFNIVGEDVVVSDVSIVNSKNSISIDGGNAVADNVSFINNTGVIYVVDGSIEIVGCYFMNNSNVVDLKSAYDVLISDTTFINDTNIINSVYSILVINNTSFMSNDAGSYCVSLIDSNAEIYSSKFNEVNLINPIFVSNDSELYLSNNTLSKSQYVLNGGTITSKTRIVISGKNYYELLIHDDLTLNATVYDDNGNIIVINDLEFNVNPTMDYNQSSQDTYWILDVYCYPSGEYEISASVTNSLSDYNSDYVLLNVSKFSSSVDFVSLDNITCGEVLNVKVECINFTSAIIEIRDAFGEVIYRQTGNVTEFSVESLDAGVYTLTYANVGDDEYESSSAMAAFEVYKIGSSVAIMDKVDSIYALNDYRINFTVSNRTDVAAKIVDLKTGEVVLNMSVYGDCLYVNLLAGSYNLTVTNVGDNNHATSWDSMVFDVLKVTSSVKVDNVTDYFYDDVVITYEVVNASEVHIVIHDLATGEVKYNFTSTNTTISNLYFDSGRYNITLSVEESESTTYSSDFKVFNVLKVGSSIVVGGLDDYVYGDDVEVSIIVDNRTSVIVEIRNEAGEIVFNNSVEEDYLPMPDLSAGEYTLVASNLATDNVAGSNYTKTFTISKANSTIDIIYFNGTVPWGYYFDVGFVGDNLTNVSVIVRDSNGDEVSGGNLTDETGYFLYRLGNLTLGDYRMEIINPGDENITGCSVLMNFTIFKGNSTVDIENITSVYVGDDVFIEYYVFVPGIIDIVIKDSLGNIVYHEENANIFNTTVSDLPAGNYTVNVTNLETENVFGNYSTGNFTVCKYDSNVTLNDVKDIVYGENVVIGFEVENPTVVNVKITDAKGNVVYDENVTDYSVVITNLDAGDYFVNVTNVETFNVTESTDSKSFRVSRAQINLTVSVDDNVYGEESVVKVTSNVDGNYTVIIGDAELVVDVVNGQGSNNIVLDAGNYTAKINFTDDNYDISITDDSFTVFKADVLLSIEVLDKVYSANVTGNVFASVDGEYKVVIGNYAVPVIVRNGVGSFDVGLLDSGNHTASVSFSDTGNYNPAYNETTFEVTQSGTNLNIIVNASEIRYGKVIEVTQSLPGDATGYVTYAFANGTVIMVVDVNGSFVLSGLNAGSYVVYANYSGDSNYAPACDSVTVVVDKAINNVEVYASDVAYGENTTFIVIADIDGQYAINVGDRKIIINVVNGIAKATLALDAGSYSTATEYVSVNYENNVTDCKFEVSKADVVLSVEVLDKVYTADVSGNVFASVDGEYEVVIANRTVQVTVKDGVGSFNVGIMDAGNYSASVSFSGTGNYNSAKNETAFEVTQTGTNFNVIVSDANVTYGALIEVTQSLPGDAAGSVTYSFANGTVIRVLGVGESFVLPVLDVGSYVIYANYSGDSNYAPACDSVTVVVDRAVNDIIIYASNVVYGENTTITVVSSTDGQYTVNVGDRKVIVDVLNGTGKATLALDAGNYSTVVEYVSGNYVNNATNCEFAVFKAGISLSIEVLDEVYGANVTGNVFSSVDGEYRVVIGGYTVPVIVKDGVGSFDVGILNVGSYGAIVIFDGNDNYNAINKETAFKVTQTGTNFNVIVSDANVTYGEVIEVTQSLPGDAAGSVTYSFANGTVIKVLDVNGSFVLSGLDAGSYVVYANYSGDSNYASASDSVTVVVNKAVNNIAVSIDDVVYPNEVTVGVAADLDGNYTVAIGDVKVIVNVLNGSGSASIALNAGDYSAVVEYGDENHVANVTDVSFKVAKADITLSVEVLDKVYTADVTGNVFASVDDDYYVLVGDVLKAVTVRNGIGEFNFGSLSAGNYTVRMIFAGNENYNANSNVSTFKVTSTGTNFNVIANCSEITYGDAINITQSLPGEATGSVTYCFANGTVIMVVDVNGSFVLSGLDVGSYVIYANYSGDSNYASASDSVTVIVNKAVNNVAVSVESVVYPANVTIIVKADVDGIYIISVNGTDFEVSVSEGIGNVSVSLAVGNYATVTSADIPNYETRFSEAEFSVSPVEDYNLTVDIVDRTVIFHAPSDATGNVTLVVGNATYVAELKNGTARITADELAEGSNNVQIAYSGDSKYAPKSYSSNLTVNTRIVASDVTRAYNSGVDYYAKVVDKDGNPLANKKVTFTVNKKTYTRTTNSQGIAKLNAKLSVGTYKVTVAISGTGKNVTKTVKIVKRVAGKNVVKYYNSNFKYRLKVLGNKGTAVGKGVKVIVKIDNKSYKLITDKNGYVTIKLTNKFTPKKYTVRATYKGYTSKNTWTIKQVLFAKKEMTVKKSARYFVLQSVLKNGKVPLKNKWVTFKFNGMKFKAKTNKNGVAKVVIKRNVINKLKIAKYAFTVTYLKDTIRGKITVRR